MLQVPDMTVPISGMVMINGEQIAYNVLDPISKTLSELGRNGQATAHVIGSSVVNFIDAQNLITTNWGNGLRDSKTIQAKFLQAQPTWLPYLPGQTALQVAQALDINAHNTRFDDDGTGEIGKPVHPFDSTSFDSYIP
jgi:hypothetical protein